MDIRIKPTALSGEISAIASKSDAHRALICAALAESETILTISSSSQDIEATISCIKAMGGNVLKEGNLLTVIPVKKDTVSPTLDCCESGSTLRFLFPLANLICENPIFAGKGRLPERPLSPLREEMELHGCTIMGNFLPITTKGRLEGGTYSLAGNISSQFISGLLFALPLCEKDSKIMLTTPLESKGYVNMTISSLKTFGIEIEEKENEYIIKGNQKYISPKTLTVEGDWSNAAFWLSAGAISGNIKCTNLSPDSNQGDKQIISILKAFGAEAEVQKNEYKISRNDLNAITLDCTDIPDLVPIISAVASVANGTTILKGVERLKIKESDRLTAVSDTLSRLGADISVTNDTLVINGKPELYGGEVTSYNDHRIVMMAAIAATRSKGDVIICDAQAVNKSYPDFFEHYKILGGVFDVI